MSEFGGLHLKDLPHDIMCCICLEPAKNAMETTCCAHLLCADCTAGIHKCPLCRVAECEFRDSVAMRRVINNMKVICDFCNVSTTLSCLSEHKFSCPEQEHTCHYSNCGITLKRAAMLSHLITEHGAETLQHNANAANDCEKVINTDRQTNTHNTALSSTVHVNGGSYQLPIATIEDHGILRRLGETGKYYCGRHVLECACCSCICGGTGNCNCVECMKCDLAARKLTKGWLVNNDGVVSIKSSRTLKYYCGRRIMLHDTRTDGHCGPNDGNNCPSCRILDDQYYTIYRNLV